MALETNLSNVVIYLVSLCTSLIVLGEVMSSIALTFLDLPQFLAEIP